MSDLEEKFAAQWAAEGLPEYVRNFKPWAPERGFEIDFAIPDRKIGIEVEGGIFRKGGHSSGAGIARDIDKHNLALFTGWRIVRVTSSQVSNGEALLLAKALVLDAPAPAFLLMKPKERKVVRRQAAKSRRSRHKAPLVEGARRAAAAYCRRRAGRLSERDRAA
jgi:very-short-patch-repair endonuclease